MQYTLRRLHFVTQNNLLKEAPIKHVLLVSLLLATSTAMAQAKKTNKEITLVCEQATVVAGDNSQAPIELTPFIIKIQDGEGSTELAAHDSSFSISEDDHVKGLYTMLLTTGKSPRSDDNGSGADVYIKKDGPVSADDLSENMLLDSSFKSDIKEGYIVLHGENLSSGMNLVATNKFAKAITAANSTVLSGSRIRYANKMTFVDALTLLNDERVKEVIKNTFQKGELIMSGINEICVKK